MAEMTDAMKRIKKDIEDDIHKFAQTYVQYAADTASFMMKEEAKRILIENFYNAYKPKIYERTYNIRDNSYEASTGKVVGGFVNGSGSYSCKAILTVSSDNMFEYPTGTLPYKDTTLIAVDVWYFGSHGGIVETGSIEDIVEKAFEDTSVTGQKIRNMAADFAYAQARYGHYKILKF